MGRTEFYDLSKLGPGEHASDEGYKYTYADRERIARLLRLGAETHRHNGEVPSASVLAPPTLSLDTNAGTLPAATRIYYKYTLVDMLSGLESAPSPEAFIDTPTPLAEPNAPTLTVATTGGSLLAGQYHYVLSAWVNVNTLETKALNPSVVTVPIGTSESRVTLVMPSLPAGAQGFNIYRRKPGSDRYIFLASQSGAANYVDSGATEGDVVRTLPVRNTTNGANSVTVEVGGVPAGKTWRVYRTTVSGDYSASLLHHVVEETFEGSGVITDAFEDLGLNPTSGAPPTSSQEVGSPPKVDLTDSAEVQGALPLSRISAFPEVVTFSFEGPLSEIRQGTSVWVCEYPAASLIGVRAALGRGYAPSTQDVIVDVNVRTVGGVYSSIFSQPADRPRVTVGNQVGARVVPTLRREIVEGECLTVDVDQIGGGATPNDADLTVNVYLYAHSWVGDDSHVPVED